MSGAGPVDRFTQCETQQLQSRGSSHRLSRILSDSASLGVLRRAVTVASAFRGREPPPFLRAARQGRVSEAFEAGPCRVACEGRPVGVPALRCRQAARQARRLCGPGRPAWVSDRGVRGHAAQQDVGRGGVVAVVIRAAVAAVDAGVREVGVAAAADEALAAGPCSGDAHERVAGGLELARKHCDECAGGRPWRGFG